MAHILLQTIACNFFRSLHLLCINMGVNSEIWIPIVAVAFLLLSVCIGTTCRAICVMRSKDDEERLIEGRRSRSAPRNQVPVPHCAPTSVVDQVPAQPLGVQVPGCNPQQTMQVLGYNPQQTMQVPGCNPQQAMQVPGCNPQQTMQVPGCNPHQTESVQLYVIPAANVIWSN